MSTSLMLKITMIIYHCKRYATAIFHLTAAIFGLSELKHYALHRVVFVQGNPIFMAVGTPSKLKSLAMQIVYQITNRRM